MTYRVIVARERVCVKNLSVACGDTSPSRRGKKSSAWLGSPARGAGAKRLRGSSECPANFPLLCAIRQNCVFCAIAGDFFAKKACNSPPDVLLLYPTGRAYRTQRSIPLPVFFLLHFIFLTLFSSFTFLSFTLLLSSRRESKNAAAHPARGRRVFFLYFAVLAPPFWGAGKAVRLWLRGRAYETLPGLRRRSTASPERTPGLALPVPPHGLPPPRC